MPEQLANPYVFVSYTSTERERALAVADALEQAGISVWIDRQAIPGGSSWSAAIVRGIKNCTVFAVLGSTKAYVSPNVQRELNLAVEENRPVLPLLLESVTPPDEVRYALAGRQWVELLDRSIDACLPDVLRALTSLGVAATPPRAAGSAGATAASEPPGNLPTPLTSFIGREQELSDLVTSLSHNRLVTLTGPGGTGKTRLALVVAQRLLATYPDGAWFVDLSAVTDPTLVPSTVARALDLRAAEGLSPADAVVAYLRRRQLLLVLDNFEQVLAAAGFVRDVLAGSLHVCALVTSRSVLHVPGEQEFPLAPLPAPDPTTVPAELGDNAAVALFLQRAQAVRPDFVLTDANAPVVAEIVRRLDGLPLAIELAAVRTRVLTLQALLARLDQRLTLLTGGAGRPERQHTLRATMQWSHDLLTEPERRLFRRLAVFVGSCTLEAAEAVANGVDGGARHASPAQSLDVLDGIESLVEKSLLQRQEAADGEPRFVMLQTIREFALTELEATAERDAISQRHHALYLKLAQPVGDPPGAGPRQPAGCADLEHRARTG